MSDWAELAGMWATAGEPGAPLSSVESFAKWIETHDQAVIDQFLASRQIVAADSAEAWRNLIHGEDHEALLRVRAEIDAMYSISEISQGVHRALIARIDGRPTESDLTEQFFAEQDDDV